MAFAEEYRRHTRVAQEISVRWRVENTERSGVGIICDISISGILIELDAFSTPDRNSIFVIQPVKPEDELFIPTRVRLVWARPLKTEAGKYFCGMEFVHPSETVVAQLSNRIDEWFTTIAEAANVNILDNYFHGKNRR